MSGPPPRYPLGGWDRHEQRPAGHWRTAAPIASGPIISGPSANGSRRTRRQPGLFSTMAATAAAAALITALAALATSAKGIL